MRGSERLALTTVEVCVHVDVAAQTSSRAAEMKAQTKLLEESRTKFRGVKERAVTQLEAVQELMEQHVSHMEELIVDVNDTMDA